MAASYEFKARNDADDVRIHKKFLAIRNLENYNVFVEKGISETKRKIDKLKLHMTGTQIGDDRYIDEFGKIVVTKGKKPEKLKARIDPFGNIIATDDKTK